MNFIRVVVALSLAAFSLCSTAEGTTDAVCSYAPSQSKVVSQITTAAGGAAAGVTAIMNAAGLTTVAHSSGAYILTGSGGYIAGTLGSAVAAPTVVTVSIAVAGGAVTLELLCAPKNHPDAVKKMTEVVGLLERQLVENASRNRLDSFQRASLNRLKTINQEAIEVRDGVARKLSSANSVAIDYRDMAYGFFQK